MIIKNCCILLVGFFSFWYLSSSFATDTASEPSCHNETLLAKIDSIGLSCPILLETLQFCRPKHDECIHDVGDSEQCYDEFRACVAEDAGENVNHCKMQLKQIKKFINEAGKKCLEDIVENSKHRVWKYLSPILSQILDSQHQEYHSDEDPVTDAMKTLKGHSALHDPFPSNHKNKVKLEEGLDTALKESVSILGIELIDWHGGSAEYVIPEIVDLIFVSVYCGKSRAPGINLVWARYRDCQEDVRSLNCFESAIEELERVAGNSETCNMYIEIVKATYRPPGTLSRGARYQPRSKQLTRISVDDTFSGNFLMHDERLFLRTSEDAPEDVYRKCSKQKRQVSFCIETHGSCRTNCDSQLEKCSEGLKDECKESLLRMKSASGESRSETKLSQPTEDRDGSWWSISNGVVAGIFFLGAVFSCGFLYIVQKLGRCLTTLRKRFLPSYGLERYEFEETEKIKKSEDPEKRPRPLADTAQSNNDNSERSETETTTDDKETSTDIGIIETERGTEGPAPVNEPLIS